MKNFKNGITRFLCSVGVLIEGVDLPLANCALLCRPTMSAVIYVQMCGRLTRINPGKENSLILDLSGNCEVHGNPATPIIVIPNPPLEKIEREEKKGQEGKECPACGARSPRNNMACWKCGYSFEVEQEFNMIYINWDLKNQTEAKGFIEEINFKRWKNFHGRESLKVEVKLGKNIIKNYYSFVEEAKHLFQKFWKEYTGNENYPKTIEEAINRQNERKVDGVEIKKDDKHWEIVKFIRSEKNE
jgi:DNA repair protein RadD